jgi:GNAT superfamily N-acetyltransferase
MNLRICEADLTDREHAEAVVAVVNAYAADPAGRGRPLSADVRERLVPALREHPTTLVLLAFVDGEPAGVAVCFYGLSTFSARPLLNIHDLAVTSQHRGKGIGRALLTAVEEHARRSACCKLTLEVQDDNSRARGLYRSFGFDDYVVREPTPTRFLVKELDG